MKLPKRTRLLGALTGAGLVLAAVGGYEAVQHIGGTKTSAAYAPPASKSASPVKVPPVVSATGLEQKNGVRITQVAVSGGGGLVDLRYQVLDTEKAAVIHGIPPVLVDERTGAVVDHLFMGHMHRGLLRTGQTYYLVF